MYDFGYEKCLEAISFQGKYRHQHIIFQGVYQDSNS